MELSIVQQEHVIVPLGSLGVTVLVRCPVVLHYPGIEDLCIQLGLKFPIVSYMCKLKKLRWSDFL